MKTRLLVITLLALIISAGSVFAQTKVIAHRGYWDCEGSAQNSIASLVKADEAGVYGSEFDVCISSDGVLVVNHDSKFRGHVLEETPYAILDTMVLKNGETMPNLEEYLIAGKKLPNTKLIFELKSCKRVVNEDRMVADALHFIRKYGLEEQTEYISFSMNICKELIRQDPTAKVFYLNGEVSPADLKKLGFAGLDYNQGVLEKNPHWVKEAHDLGLQVNVWTVNDPAKMKYFIDLGVDFITTDKPLEVKALLAK